MNKKINAEKIFAKKEGRRDGRTETTTMGRSLRVRSERKGKVKPAKSMEDQGEKTDGSYKRKVLKENSAAEAGVWRRRF